MHLKTRSTFLWGRNAKQRAETKPEAGNSTQGFRQGRVKRPHSDSGKKATEILAPQSQRMEWGSCTCENLTKTASGSNFVRNSECEITRVQRHCEMTRLWTMPPAGSWVELQYPHVSKCFYGRHSSSHLLNCPKGKWGVYFHSYFTNEKTEAWRVYLGLCSIQESIRIRTKTPNFVLCPTCCVSRKHNLGYVI